MGKGFDLTFSDAVVDLGAEEQCNDDAGCSHQGMHAMAVNDVRDSKIQVHVDDDASDDVGQCAFHGVTSMRWEPEGPLVVLGCLFGWDFTEFFLASFLFQSCDVVLLIVALLQTLDLLYTYESGLVVEMHSLTLHERSHVVS
jgi:hypothetical protein